MDFKCYSMREDYNIRFGNRMSGITLFVNAKRSSNTFVPELASWKAIKYSGVGIAVIPKKSSVYSAVQAGVKLLSPDSNNDVMITKTVIDRTAQKQGLIMKNKNGCVDEENESFHMDLVSPYSEHYSADQCFLHNKQLSYSSVLNCTIPILPQPNGVPKENCTPLEYIKYYDLQIYRNKSRTTDRTCLLDCIEEKFRVEISSSVITPEITKLVNSVVQRNVTLVMLTLFVEGMDHTVIKFNGQSLDDVLSEVGGVLGFWFGGSIITFIEFLFAFTGFLYLVIGQLVGC
ncbi:amiloride-sensitive sodium channel subunit beta [Eurytemora carolleeae]|uniref:amiloride-sensitive sodium channel subunit beta n=1 Tax=Eurytemora carolleeae TaxID=1294199 RepID=UPI000C77F18D|nr:amiloride-sensitive sodium channel subunit beta [Eurytemora carolleeae]|eukprot:XP_023346573.1 amiloride-sensitive sodium channel subunit beta-like [Eurytemora affinis]